MLAVNETESLKMAELFVADALEIMHAIAKRSITRDVGNEHELTHTIILLKEAHTSLTKLWEQSDVSP